MTAYRSDLPGRNNVKAVRRDTTYLRMSVAIGATGAVGTITSDDGAWGITRSSAGVYTGTFPKSAKGSPPKFDWVAAAGASAAIAYQVTAHDPAAGTYGVTFVDAAGAAVELSNPTTLYVEVFLDEGV